MRISIMMDYPLGNKCQIIWLAQGRLNISQKGGGGSCWLAQQAPAGGHDTPALAHGQSVYDGV